MNLKNVKLNLKVLNDNNYNLLRHYQLLQLFLHILPLNQLKQYYIKLKILHQIIILSSYIS